MLFGKVPAWLDSREGVSLAPVFASLSVTVPPVPGEPLVPPSDALAFQVIRPALIVVPALYVLAPPNASVPEPALVSVIAPPPIAPLTVRVCAFTVTLRLALGVTAPVPMVRSLLPMNV